MEREFVSAVIPAAGTGSRMNSAINKQYLMLEGKPILAHTLEAFDRCPRINEIIIVVSENEKELFKKIVLKYLKLEKKYKIISGGRTRQESVYFGLLNVDRKSNIVVIHDGARPLVSNKEIIDTINAAWEDGGCVLAVPVKDTIKKVNEKGFVDCTVEREKLFSVQTPQTFKKELILQAHERAIRKNFLATDDGMLFEDMGLKVKVVKGSYDNIKITTAQDLIIAQQLLAYKKL